MGGLWGWWSRVARWGKLGVVAASSLTYLQGTPYKTSPFLVGINTIYSLFRINVDTMDDY